jgi:hypothetical protein
VAGLTLLEYFSAIFDTGRLQQRQGINGDNRIFFLAVTHGGGQPHRSDLSLVSLHHHIANYDAAPDNPSANQKTEAELFPERKMHCPRSFTHHRHIGANVVATAALSIDPHWY